MFTSLGGPGWDRLGDAGAAVRPLSYVDSGADQLGWLGLDLEPYVAPTAGGDFTFDPLPPGTNLKIVKRLVFEGLDPLLPGETYLGKLDVFQYPTVPEPATGLLALMILPVAVRLVRWHGW